MRISPFSGSVRLQTHGFGTTMRPAEPWMRSAGEGGGEKFPAYPAIATFATKSADGKSLYLLVFNKDPDNAVNAEIELKNFKTASGESIQLYQEKVEATDYFSGLAGTVTVKDGKFSATYPKHSLTAYEIKLQ